MLLCLFSAQLYKWIKFLFHEDLLSRWVVAVRGPVVGAWRQVVEILKRFVGVRNWVFRDLICVIGVRICVYRVRNLVNGVLNCVNGDPNSVVEAPSLIVEVLSLSVAVLNLIVACLELSGESQTRNDEIPCLSVWFRRLAVASFGLRCGLEDYPFVFAFPGAGSRHPLLLVAIHGTGFQQSLLLVAIPGTRFQHSLLE
uniref:Uncharacterized protein n=1 Tax=Candidatus Kentrum sp. LPFa TaxID=2126335 RepID=A0A450VZP8_9GAMM|nr:MAG: hypothetical protein BECKLPF1236B_GA0070989_10149 [Candidatus Kentron sp. LPFa]